MIDEFYDYCYGELEYRSLRFETEVLDMGNYQGNAVVNYTDYEVPYTVLLSISTSSLGHSRRLLSQENIRQHGRREKSHIIPLMIRRMTSSLTSTSAVH